MCQAASNAARAASNVTVVPAGAFAWSAAGVEAAAPFPLIGAEGIAGSDRNRADIHVAVIDAPAFLREVMNAAAGEGEHAPIMPQM
jgi:hypothetical protein